jgi:hypothetical protein
MNTITLTGTSDKGAVVTGWACGVCLTPYSNKGLADRCCQCDLCKLEVPRGYSRHDECRREYERKLEAYRLAKATKLEDWDGPVFWGDELYPDIDAAVEAMECDLEPSEYPEWLYVAKRTRMDGLDPEHIVSSAYDLNPDYTDTDAKDMAGFAEFQAACEAFTEANKNCCLYDIDYTRAVKVTRPEGSEQA